MNHKLLDLALLGQARRVLCPGVTIFTFLTVWVESKDEAAVFTGRLNQVEIARQGVRLASLRGRDAMGGGLLASRLATLRLWVPDDAEARHPIRGKAGNLLVLGAEGGGKARDAVTGLARASGMLASLVLDVDHAGLLVGATEATLAPLDTKDGSDNRASGGMLASSSSLSLFAAWLNWLNRGSLPRY